MDQKTDVAQRMRIWRVEDERGRGVGATGFDKLYFAAAVRAIQRFDEPEARVGVPHIRYVAGQDGLTDHVSEHDRFGCADLQTLRRWFPSTAGCQAIERAGGLLVAYEAPADKVKTSPVRAYFDHRYAIKVDVLPVTALNEFSILDIER